MSLRVSGAPRSESKITMTASGSHTLMWLTLAWQSPQVSENLRRSAKAPLADQGELPQCAHWG